MTPVGPPRAGRDSAPSQDDWDHHWDVHGALADSNPANVYRRYLVTKLLGDIHDGATVLDIGSGQGELAIYLKQVNPGATVWGAENSSVGVERSRSAAAALGVEVNFIQRDLLKPVEAEADQAPATHAVCSEVLEHVDDPVRLMRNAIGLLAPGCRVVVTVPGGPRTAFDKHIGHRRHYSAPSLCEVLTEAGLDVQRVLRAGFPFFNCYKLAVMANGRRLIQSTRGTPGRSPSRLEAGMLRAFDAAFSYNSEDSTFGWQMAALCDLPGDGPP